MTAYLDPGSHADLVDDHETREFLPVDQDDALRTLGHKVLRGLREPGGGHEHALGCVRRIDRPGEVLKVTFTHGGAGVFFWPGDTPRPARARLPGSCRRCRRHPAALSPGLACDVTLAIAHGDQEIHHHAFEKRRGRVPHSVQEVGLKCFA